jgi:phosphatidylserine decarboxylase precursor
VFVGHLLPVAPVVANMVRGLFALNERVVLQGKWDKGLFYMVPVGATNVGTISVTFDEVMISIQSFISLKIRKGVEDESTSKT